MAKVKNPRLETPRSSRPSRKEKTRIIKNLRLANLRKLNLGPICFTFSSGNPDDLSNVRDCTGPHKI